MIRFVTVLAFMFSLLPLKAQESGLSRHNFLYAGQSKQLRLFKVENGQVSWMHHATNWRGEFSDAILMTDGHILLAHQYGIAEINQDHQVLWSYAAPKYIPYNLSDRITWCLCKMAILPWCASWRFLRSRLFMSLRYLPQRAFMDSSAMHGYLHEARCWFAI